MIEFKNISFRYEEGESDSLQDVNFRIERGELVLFTGRSGCGKTTITRLLNGLIPHYFAGQLEGEVLLNGESVLHMKPDELAGIAGTVFQDPRSQFFMTDTTRELAFGCENIGLAQQAIVDRVVNTVEELQISSLLNRSIFTLSSGEKQQIAIGSVHALMPQVYILDEPSANLDYSATQKLAMILRKIKESGGTILAAEHKFYYLRALIDRVYYLDRGQITKVFSSEEFCVMDDLTREHLGLRTLYPEKEILFQSDVSRETSPPKKLLLEARGLSFAYKKGNTVLNNVSFQAKGGDIVGILGANGAGKSTLLSILTGLLKEKIGSLQYNGTFIGAKKRRALSYLVMQDADYQLFGSSVSEELSLGVEGASEDRINEVLASLGLLELKDRHPASLSGGQKQRVTIAAAIIKDCSIFCFDEPTSGLDYDAMCKVSALIKNLAEQGAMVFLISHDYEFIVRTCTRTIQLNNMEIECDTALTQQEVGKLTHYYFSGMEA